MGSFERPLSEEEWYDTAKVKVESLLRKMDPDLEVSVSPITVHHKEGEEYDTLSLSFKHKTNPALNWTMKIRKDFDYIENELEDVVRKIYRERTEET